MFSIQINAQNSLSQGAPQVQQALEAGLVGSLHKNLLAETFIQAGPVVKFVLFFLILLSIVCWGIIIYKFIALRRAEKAAAGFNDLFSNATSLMEIYHASRNIPTSHLLEVFDAGYRELTRFLASSGSSGSQAGTDLAVASLKEGGVQNIARSMQKAKSKVTTGLERHLIFLATTGSTAPFIGLFGTVWGIMSAFRNIGISGNANLATVAPGIAEALIATAVGLFAAIPAVVAYNFFLQQVRVLTEEMENFSSDLVNLIERHLRKT